jgi:hypothetical protein
MSSNKTEEKEQNPVILATTPGYRYHRVVPMLQQHEGKELTLPMVVLTGRENSDVEAKCYADTLMAFNGKPPKTDEPSNWDQLLDANRAYWTIFYATRHPDDLSKKWFLSKQGVEDIYSWDDIGILSNHHLTVRLTQPHLVNLDPKDPGAIQATIEKIKSLGTDSDFFLNGFTTHSVNLLLKSLVAQLETLQNTNGSSGSQ